MTCDFAGFFWDFRLRSFICRGLGGRAARIPHPAPWRREWGTQGLPCRLGSRLGHPRLGLVLRVEDEAASIAVSRVRAVRVCARMPTSQSRDLFGRLRAGYGHPMLGGCGGLHPTYRDEAAIDGAPGCCGASIPIGWVSDTNGRTWWPDFRTLHASRAVPGLLFASSTGPANQAAEPAYSVDGFADQR